MKIVIAVILVRIFLTDYMPSVARRIYEYVAGLLLEPAFYDRFEIFLIGLKILKRQIIHEDYEPVIAVLDHIDDVI